MKKLIVFIATVLQLASCSPDYNYMTTITYRIHYPDVTITKYHSFASTDNPGYILSSDRGSNYLYVYGDVTWPGHGQEKIEDTSAPIEVVAFTKKLYLNEND